MSMDMKVELVGLEEVMRKLTPDLYAKPVRKLLTDASNLLVAEAKHRAPVDTGHLRRSITKDVDSAKVPTWAKVGSNVTYAPFMEFGTGTMATGPGGKRPRHWPPATPQAISFQIRLARIIWSRWAFITASAIKLNPHPSPIHHLPTGPKSERSSSAARPHH